MKIKLSYFTNGEKLAFEEKIEGFPNTFWNCSIFYLIIKILINILLFIIIINLK
jgi:hypothetical protein